jgi:hypothetical protein
VPPAANAGIQCIPVIERGFPLGTSRTNLYLDIEGWGDHPSMTADYLMGPQIADLEFEEGRIFSDRWGDGSVVVNISWPQICYRCRLSNTFAVRTELEDHNVGNLGCGSANHCNLDGQFADEYSGGWNSNSNQRTVGGVCTLSNPDPSSGTYVGHGRNESWFSGEGNYYAGESGCTSYDFEIYTTWVR